MSLFSQLIHALILVRKDMAGLMLCAGIFSFQGYAFYRSTEGGLRPRDDCAEGWVFFCEGGGSGWM